LIKYLQLHKSFAIIKKSQYHFFSLTAYELLNGATPSIFASFFIKGGYSLFQAIETRMETNPDSPLNVMNDAEKASGKSWKENLTVPKFASLFNFLPKHTTAQTA
jgi:hypothetical protein